MAASVYATPPPDLSGEEAALSDASNSSHTNSSHGSALKASKRTLSSSFLNVATTATSNTQSSTPTNASQLSSDSLPDLSKKRRKQSMPIRFSANGTAIEGPAPSGGDAVDEDLPETGRPSLSASPATEVDNEPDEGASATAPASAAAAAAAAAAMLLEEQQNNFQKIFLSNLSQLQQKHLQLQHADGFLPLGNPDNFLSSKLNSLIAFGGSRSEEATEASGRDDENEPDDEGRPRSCGGKREEGEDRERTPDGSGKENGKSDPEEGEGEVQQQRDDHGAEREAAMKRANDGDEQQQQHHQHQQQEQQEQQPDPTQSGVNESSGHSHPKITMKKELFMDPEWDGEIRSSSLPKPDDWISIAGLSFPFAPEAAAALSASGYLPQLPQLLGVPGVSGGFGAPTDGSSRTGVPPLRIFNPEAYCDLCNKEFCNKYFLKTHKANKHGIYEPAASSSSSSAGGNNSGSSDNGNAASALSAMASPFNSIHQLSQVFQMQQQQQQQQHQQQHQQQQQQQQQQQLANADQLDKLSSGQAGDANQQLMVPTHHQQQVQSGTSGQQQMQPGGATKQPTQQGTASGRSTQSPKVTPTSHIQPTVFCDICFKKFSSLSAMRKHRSKAHELARGSGGAGGAGGNHQQLQHQLHHQQQQQQQQQQLQQQQIQQQQHQLQQQLQQHLHLQYQQQMQQHLDSKPVESGDADAPPLQLPDGFREDYTVEQEDATFTPQPRKLSPHSMQAAREANFSADKLRRLGVVNPEAFCEICCKEYCNKYFLRTHRLKRHGILPTPDELKDESRGHNPWAPFMQTAPLNLIMGGTAADFVSAQMALQAPSPSSLKKFLAAAAAAGELAGDAGSGSIEGAKGSTVEIKQEQLPFAPCKAGRDRLLNGGDGGGGMMDSGADSDEQAHQSDGGNAGDSGEERPGARDAGSDEDAEAISVDLQKLQSMIMQLNDLNSLQQQHQQQQQQHLHRKVGCGVCGKELANQYLLHAHMIQEHGALVGDNNNGPGQKNGSSREATPLVEPAEVCRHCDKEFANMYLLKQHLVEVHGAGALPGSSSSPKREGFVTPERPTQPGPIPMPPTGGGGAYGERKPASFSMTPTSSYCEICNKELCNKYFMKTHMQRMHGIEIENGAQIGGVVCNICNKELCSKYFLRVHKHNTHGIVEEGAPLPQPRQNGSSGSGGGGGAGGGGGGGGGSGSGAGSSSGAGTDPSTGENGEVTPGAAAYQMVSGAGDAGLLKPGEISDLSNRYYSHFTEVCPLCSRRFRSAKWLRAHLLSDHGKSGIEKLKDLEQKLAANGGGSVLGGGGNGRSKSNSPSLKVPNGMGDGAPKYGPKSPFPAGLGPAEAAKFLPKGGAAAAAAALFGPDQPPSPMGGLKGYQCSYCSFATPLLPLLFIHERSHSSLNIVQQQLIQQQQQQQLKQEEVQAHAAGGFPVLLKSESAVSLAKDQPAGQLMPAGTSSETPSSTPASTPVPSLSQDALHLLQRPQSTHSPVARPTSSSGYEEPAGSPQHPEESCSKPCTVGSPKPASPPAAAGEPNSMLAELANLTQRPAVYALPQQPRGGPLMMQSFLIEECGGGGGGGRGPHSPSGADSDKEAGGLDHRFVPAVVFLPVKERILTPMTISFNLSPA